MYAGLGLTDVCDPRGYSVWLGSSEQADGPQLDDGDDILQVPSRQSKPEESHKPIFSRRG
jgi:hypothetical protein